jgi:hypothetical protein
MLDPDIMRATGDNESRLLFVGFRFVSFCNRGEGRRACIGCDGGPLATLCRSGEVSSSVGGAAGNINCFEKELDAFRVMLGMCGVLGVDVAPERLRPGRAGNANSLELSWTAGGDDRPPARGDGCVAERWPGELTDPVSCEECQ